MPRRITRLRVLINVDATGGTKQAMTQETGGIGRVPQGRMMTISAQSIPPLTRLTGCSATNDSGGDGPLYSQHRHNPLFHVSKMT